MSVCSRFIWYSAPSQAFTLEWADSRMDVVLIIYKASIRLHSWQGLAFKIVPLAQLQRSKTYLSNGKYPWICNRIAPTFLTLEAHGSMLNIVFNLATTNRRLMGGRRIFFYTQSELVTRWSMNQGHWKEVRLYFVFLQILKKYSPKI